MSDHNPDSGFFHCGRCGNLFVADLGATAVRRCPECGHDPVPPGTRREPLVLPGPADAMDAPDQDTRNSDPGGTRRNRSSHRKHTTSSIRNLILFIAVWVLVLAFFAVWVKLQHGRDEREESERSGRFKEARAAQQAVKIDHAMQERERVFLNQTFPKCQNAFLSFLSSTAPESRSQWVVGGPAMIGKMTRFQGSTSLFLPAEAPELEFAGVIETGKGPLVETLWKSKEGYRMEAVFQCENDEWRLDWEGFTRFSEMPWPMFAAGAGQEVQEFRLFARERLAGERKMDPAFSLVLHPPRFGMPDEVGTPSPEFVVPKLSGPGRKLQALFELHHKRKFPLGAKVPSEDPDDMIRLRVRIRRTTDSSGVKKFEIEDVLAGHWLGVADSGIPEEKAEDPNTEPAAGGTRSSG